MRSYMKFAALAATLTTGLAMAPALYAQDASKPDAPVPGAMAPGMMDQGGMMGQGGMMQMMTQMSQMMGNCNKMMQANADGSGMKQPMKPMDGQTVPKDQAG